MCVYSAPIWTSRGDKKRDTIAHCSVVLFVFFLFYPMAPKSRTQNHKKQSLVKRQRLLLRHRKHKPFRNHHRFCTKQFHSWFCLQVFCCFCLSLGFLGVLVIFWMQFFHRSLGRFGILLLLVSLFWRTFVFVFLFALLLVRRFSAFFCSFVRRRDCSMLLSRSKIVWLSHFGGSTVGWLKACGFHFYYSLISSGVLNWAARNWATSLPTMMRESE